MKKTGVAFPEGPGNDIFITAAEACQDVETRLCRSEYDQTVYELGKTAFLETPSNGSLAIQKRAETNGPNTDIVKFDLIRATGEDMKAWVVLATVDDQGQVSWSDRTEHSAEINGDINSTAQLYQMVKDTV